MNCAEVKELLSAFFDDELSGDERANVGSHVEACPSCAKELGEFRDLSVLSRRTSPGEASTKNWQRIVAGLDGASAIEVAASRRPAVLRWFAADKHRIAGLGLTAAALLLAVVWLGGRGDRSGDGAAADAAFGQYLDEFRRDPRAAQQRLFATYNGQSLDPGRAERAVGFRPAFATGLPPGYTIESVNVMTMPCCKCVQCVCKRADGSTLAIFEHGGGRTDPYAAENPQVCVECAEGRCMMLRSGDAIAASWHRDGRHITVVGANNPQEVGRLTAWFSDPRRT